MNDISAIYDQMENLKEEQAQLNIKYTEEIGLIEDEMILLQTNCPHSSCSKKDSPTSTQLVVCNICGKILIENITNGT